MEPFSDRPDRFPSLRARLRPRPGRRRRARSRCTSCWPHKGRFVLKLEGVDSIDAAEALRGLELRIGEEELPALPAGSYYHHQLKGLRVEDGGGRAVGRGGGHPGDRRRGARAGGARRRAARRSIPLAEEFVRARGPRGRAAGGGRAGDWWTSMLRIDVVTIFPRMIEAPARRGHRRAGPWRRGWRGSRVHDLRDVHRRPPPHRGRRALRRRAGDGHEGGAVLPRGGGRAAGRARGAATRSCCSRRAGSRFDQAHGRALRRPRPPGAALRPLRGRRRARARGAWPPRS